jgi:CRP/FNR family transcriptional regulator
MDITKQIKDIDLFKGVSHEKLSSLIAQATYKKFKSGEMVIGETDPIRSFYVVISGQLKLYRSSPEGKEQTLQLLGQGDPFGLCTAFATDSFPASAMAIEDSAVLLIPGTVQTGTGALVQHHSDIIPTPQGFHDTYRISCFKRNSRTAGIFPAPFITKGCRR